MPSTDLHLDLRDAEPRDLPAITAIYGHWVEHGTSSFELEPPALAEMTRRFESLRAGGFPFLVAEAGHEIAGYACVGPYRPRPAYRSTVEDSVYIAPDFAGRGIGRRLLAALIAAATARRFRQMVAVMGDPENSGSAQLHASLGFEVVGLLRGVGFKHGRWRDTLLMQRALGAGDEAPAEE
ncbi:GNAT family N-acetyltransferase [Methylobrevis pamukkalensis]|uniref:Phosphinothricin N-acetyltransferase n=1 Tax=Methylobrevis pamukkalensis TaxID=1439726 RepID=A0A1E3H274_9HYPH|nr:GNAT family N-acetyltransferase [Methylobrevis pamukkalensis]ODN70412.1 Phosphinothricin N-acetyltransferase [Methylobrevis pamukkalensis]